MRIALVGARSHPARHGGIERAVQCLAEEYVARGHEVSVLVADAGRPPVGAGPSVERVRALRGKYVQALSQAVASVPRLSRRRFDVVHVHGIGPGMVIPLVKARRLPVVLTVHALDFERDKWPAPAKRLFRLLSGPGARRADRVLCVGEHLRPELRRLYGVDALTVPNGVALPAPADARPLLDSLGLAPHAFLLFVGRLVPEKRVDVLLRAHAALPEGWPLVVVGSGTGSYAAEHELRLRELAGHDVLFLGEQPHDVVAALMSTAALLVNPSSLEGLPLTVLEARAAAAPLVLSDIPPHREAAGPSTTLFPVDDVPALTSALGGALARLEALREAAAGERAAVLERWSWSAVADRTLAVYAEVVGRGL